MFFLRYNYSHECITKTNPYPTQNPNPNPRRHKLDYVIEIIIYKKKWIKNIKNKKLFLFIQ